MLKGLIFLIYTSMDKKLLEGLDNLSEALVMIAEALDKKGQQSNSATTNALMSGDFTTQIKEINVGIKSIKKDTKKILENQQTILEMSKKKDKKSSLIEDVGGDQKAESNLKKGVTTILLIAVGVLAIGLAFKLVGSIDFLSVVGLSLAMVLVSIAFEKIAKLNLPINKARDTSFIMIIMAFGITLSSWILKMVVPISFGQAMTAILIAGMFTVISFGIGKLMGALGKSGLAELGKSILFLPLILPAIALAITLSSWILTMVTPISFGQAMTAILIAGMFTVISYGIGKLIKSLAKSGMAELGKSILFLPLILPAIALAIALSSWVLKMTTPISLGQAITGILIAGMFSVIAYGMAKLITAFKGMKDDEIAAAVIGLPLLLPAMAVAIAVSSWILKTIMPISFGQALTAILIAALFVVLSYGMEKIVKSIGKMNWGDIPKIPVFFTLMAVAIAAAAVVFSNYSKEINAVTFMMLFKVLILGAAMGIVMIIIGVAMKVMGKLSLGDVIKVPIMFTLLAVAIALSAVVFYQYRKEVDGISFTTMFKILFFSACLAISVAIMAVAVVVINKLGSPQFYLKGGISILIMATTIMASSLILSEGKYDKHPGLMWSLLTGLSIVIFGVVVDLLNTIGSVATFVKGGIAILIVAATIMAASHILNLGKYNKYPSLEWVIGVGAGLAAFGIAAVLLGTQVLNPFFYGGLAEILLVAGTIVATSYILAAGKYGNYPKASWVMGVGLAIGAFGLAAIVLGTQVLNPFFYAGLGEILLVSGTIVEASKILAKGNYKGGPSLGWATGVSMLLGAFGTAAVILGILPKSFVKDGISAIKQIAQVIPDISKIIAKGNYKGGPTLAWAAGTAALLAGFGAAVVILGILPKMFVRDGISAITQITNVIPNVSKILAKGVYKGGPTLEWSAKTGVMLSIFSAQILMLGALPNSLIIDGALGIKRIVMSIVNTSITFWNNQKYFKPIDKNWVTSLKSTIGTFLDIVKQTKKVSFLDVLGVKWMAHKIVDAAEILWKGRKFFSTIIDPNYIKNLSSNILGFATLAKKLTALNKGTGLIKSMFGLDPVSQTANSMVKLASAYDKMATALKKFGGALASIDGKKVDIIRRLTGNMAVLAAMNEQAFGSMMSTLENKGSVFAQLLDADKTKGGPVVGEGKGKKGPMDLKAKPKSKYGETYQQLDIMIDLLNNINHNTSSLDDFLAKQGFQADAVVDLTMKK